VVVVDNRVLRKMFGSMRVKVTGGWKKLHNEDVRNMSSSPSLIRMVKSRIIWIGNATRMGRRGMGIGCWWESQKERDH
jgi:hypothetical protein